MQRTAQPRLSFIPKPIRAAADFYVLLSNLNDERRLAQMAFLHRHPPAPVTDVFHRRKLVLAYMSRRGLGSSAKAAFLLVTAGIAQMTRIICNRTARFTCMSHVVPPLKRGLAVISQSVWICDTYPGR
jgi:hypothetical protein